MNDENENIGGTGCLIWTVVAIAVVVVGVVIWSMIW